MKREITTTWIRADAETKHCATPLAMIFILIVLYRRRVAIVTRPSRSAECDFFFFILLCFPSCITNCISVRVFTSILLYLGACALYKYKYIYIVVYQVIHLE